MKCGRVLLSVVGGCTVVCDVCGGRFDGVESFTNHLKTSHSDYGLQNDGWGKITVKEETTCQDEIEDQVDTVDSIASGFAGYRFSGNSSSTKSIITVPQNITENAHLDEDSNKNVPNEFTVKNEVYIGDYVIQDPVCNTPSYEAIGNGDYIAQDEDQMEADCDNTVDSNCLSDDSPMVSNEHRLDPKQTSKVHSSEVGKSKAVKELEAEQAKCRFCHNQFENPTKCYLHEKTHIKEGLNSSKAEDNESQSLVQVHELGAGSETNSARLENAIKNEKTTFGESGTEKGDDAELIGKPSTELGLEPEFDEERNFCITCNRQMTSKAAFRFHKMRHISESRRLKLRNGWKIIKQSGRIVVSENPKFDNDKRFCITCSRGFASEISFRAHKQAHRRLIRKRQGDLPKSAVPCEFCTRKYTSKAFLRLHVVPYHGDKIPKIFQDDPTYLNCRFCHSQFEKPTERYLHEKKHGKEQKPFRCSLCPNTFSTDWKRKKHELHLHKLKRKTLEMELERVKMVFSENPDFDHAKNFCITCNHKFTSKGKFKYHKQQHKMQILKKQGLTKFEPTLSCELCSERYRSSFALRQHVVMRHGDMIPNSFKDDPSYLRCRFCQKQFEKPTERYEHEKNHATEPKSYRCSLCPKSFSTTFKRKNHERQWHTLSNDGKKTELQTKTLERERVKMVFSENPEFDNAKNFCITCNHKFSSKSKFKYHEHQHNQQILEKRGLTMAEPTLSCELCFGQFRTSFALRQHVVVHHGDMIPNSLKDDPSYLRCRFCHKQFERPTERYQHEKIHATEEKPYKCRLCPKSFKRPSHFKVHESTHR